MAVLRKHPEVVDRVQGVETAVDSNSPSGEVEHIPRRVENARGRHPQPFPEAMANAGGKVMRAIPPVNRPGLRTRLIRVFAIPVLVISVATLLGIFVAQSILQDLLMRNALEGEATHYWSLYERNQEQPLPNTDNLRGYLGRDDLSTSAPPEVSSLAPGYHRIPIDGEQNIVHVSENRGARLFLVFDSESVTDLAFYFGILPLSIVLLLVYGLLYLVYRLSQRAISPIVQLATYLKGFDFSKGGHLDLNLDPWRSYADPEVSTMIDAVSSFSERLNEFVERERVFTRDASHELRTPVAVFKGSLDLLERNSDRPASDRNALRRMRRTVEDMEELIETLLLLAREEAIEPQPEAISINELVREQIALLSPLASDMGNQLRIEETGELKQRIPPKVVRILFNNLIRNAINYTRQGTVTAIVSPTSVRIVDSGMGMTDEELRNAFEPFYRGDSARGQSKGHGLGLSIVKRLALQFHWTVSARSRPGQGTTMEVQFNPEPVR